MKIILTHTSAQKYHEKVRQSKEKAGQQSWTVGEYEILGDDKLTITLCMHMDTTIAQCYYTYVL